MEIFPKKRGLSRLAINLLLGSLILILGVIIWIIIRGGTGSENQKVFNDSQLDLKISQVKKVDDNTLDLTLKRGTGEGEFVGLNFVVNDGRNTEIIKLNTSLVENDTGNFSLDFMYINASNIKSISVTPIYLNEEGTLVTGNVKDQYITPNICSNYCPFGAQCGLNGCGMQCGEGCTSGYLCLNYKCIKQQTSSGGGGSGGSSGGSSGGGGSSTPTCTDTCESLGYGCGTQTICSTSTNCGTCTTGYECISGNCSECQSNDHSSCYNGDVYWYNSCDQIEEIRYDCLSNQTCSSGACVDCTTHTSSNCSSGDVYWWNSCGQREEIRYDCNSTQTCSSGACVNNPVIPPQTGAIIIDHTTTNVSKIPLSCINKIKTNLHVAYSHTSHGSQLYSGMLALEAQNPLYGIDFDGNLGQLHFEDYYGYGDQSGFATGGCYDLSACDNGEDGLLGPTREFLDSAEGQDINIILWSWCSIAGHNIPFYLSTMQTAITEYPDVKFAFITGHAEGGGEGDASDSRNEIIRDFVNNNVFCETHQCILFDFADMENYDPDNNYFLDKNVRDNLAYNSGNWGVEYITRHPTGLNADLTDYIAEHGGCSHSEHILGANVNCALKGQATWWMMARMAGWDGVEGHECV